MKKGNYYYGSNLTIPVELARNRFIPANAKLLYGDIVRLSTDKGKCYEVDRAFSDWYGVSENSVQNWLRELEENNYISREVIRDEKTLEILQRVIKVCE